MAEAILFDVAIEIIKKLGSVAVQEIGLVWGVEDELHKLENTVSTIRAVLLDAEEQRETNHEVRDWLEKLNDAVYDADDLLDDFSTEVLRRKVMTQNKRAKKVRVFFSSSNQLAFSLKMGHQVKAIRKSLDAIAADRTKFHFIERPVEPQVQMNRERETHSFVRAEEIIGRDNDKRAIVELLMDSNVEENVSIIPIVGIGGIGKTALAQLVYNDEKVKKHFELQMWVCVLDVFDVKLIAEKIIESATSKSGPKLENLEVVQQCLRKEIDGKSYLLVLDDVWNDNRERWLKLKGLLMGGSRGSKIIVTTRTELVAENTGSISPYHLKGLSENESWSLFKQMAFKQGKEPEDPRLVAIGKEIIEKCAGVPIAIRTLGSILYSKDKYAEWLNFKNNDMAKIAQEENVIPLLKLSYDHLPTNLKQCFAFCSLYPKDHRIDKETLIQLWIAHGFIQSLDESQNLEDVGDSYFIELFRRSLFQDVEKDKCGNIIKCKMHDLIHDLAQLVAGNRSCMVKLDTKNVTERLRHMSFDSFIIDSSWKIPTHLLRANKIRTFLLSVQDCDPSETSMINFETIVSNFKRLRVLDLNGFGIKTGPSHISKLKHLRYLDLSWNRSMRTLPSSITKLQHLQTLKLSECTALKELPRDIRELVSLRHLELDGCYRLTHMPCGLGQLTSLRTLGRFVVGDKDSCNSGLMIGGLSELKGLNNLRGELRIEELGRGGTRAAAAATATANNSYLKGKEYLQSLVLNFSYYGDGDDHEL